jgi:hypothetical protein
MHQSITFVFKADLGFNDASANYVLFLQRNGQINKIIIFIVKRLTCVCIQWL